MVNMALLDGLHGTMGLLLDIVIDTGQLMRNLSSFTLPIVINLSIILISILKIKIVGTL
jgi:hypothetical protein